MEIEAKGWLYTYYKELLKDPLISDEVKKKVEEYMKRAAEDVILAFYVDNDKVYVLLDDEWTTNSRRHAIRLVDLDEILSHDP